MTLAASNYAQVRSLSYPKRLLAAANIGHQNRRRCPNVQSVHTCWTQVRGRCERRRSSSLSVLAAPTCHWCGRSCRRRWRKTPLQAEVDDAVQDTFVECMRQDGPLERAEEDRGDFRGYLFGVVASRGLSTSKNARAAGRTTMQTRTSPRSKAATRTVSAVFDRQWAHTLMREAGDLMRVRAAASSPRCEAASRTYCACDSPRSCRSVRSQFNGSMEPDAVHRAYAKAREEFRSLPATSRISSH